MSIQSEISFHGMEGTDALLSDIEKQIKKLERFAPGMIRCTVVLEHAEHRHHKGNRYVVRIRTTLPGGEVDVSNVPAVDQTHEDAYVAIRDGFSAMRRRLQDFRRKQQGKVKRHASER